MMTPVTVTQCQLQTMTDQHCHIYRCHHFRLGWMICGCLVSCCHLGEDAGVGVTATCYPPQVKSSLVCPVVGASLPLPE